MPAVKPGKLFETASRRRIRCPDRVRSPTATCRSISVSDDRKKAAVAEAIIRSRCVISVQVLNETANVLLRKRKYSWAKIAPFLRLIRLQCPVEPLTLEIHDTAQHIAEHYVLQCV
jgi:predicted nucleic acid-binding protein